MTDQGGYESVGSGSCKSVSVEIDRALDESHYDLSVFLRSDFVPSQFRLRMKTLDPAMEILRFMSDHIGRDGFFELTVPVTDDSRFVLVKDPEQNDRFFLKFFGEGVFIEQTFGGLSGASLIKALAPALTEARTP